MGYEDLFGALGRRIAPDLVDDGPIEPQTIIDRLTRKGINDIENPRPRAVEPARAPAPKARTLSDQMNDFDPAPRPEGDRSLKDQLSDFDNLEAPIPRPRPEKAGDGFSASEVPLPKPRPDVGPAPVTGDEVVEPTLEAPFRTGGKPADKLWGSEGGMLSGDEAYKIRTDRIAGAQSAVTEAEARLAAAQERARAAGDTTTGLTPGTPGQLQRMAIFTEVENAKAALDNARRSLDAAGREPIPTQTALRTAHEAVSKSARGMVASSANAVRGMIESVGDPTEGTIFAGGKVKDPAREAAAAQALKKVTGNIDAWAEEPKPDPAREKELLSSQLPAGAASMAMFMAGGFAARALSIPSVAASAGLGALAQGGDQFKEAEQALASLNQRLAAYKEQGIEPPADLEKQRDKLLFNKYVALYAGMGIGTTEAVPIERFFNRLNQVSQGKLSGVLASSTAQSVEETLQEAGQAIGSNVIAKFLYEEGRDIFKDVADNALVGGILGALMGGGAGMANLRGRSAAKAKIEAGLPTPDVVPPPTQEELERQAKGEPALPPGVQTQGGSGGASPAETQNQTPLAEPRVAPQPAPDTPPPAQAAEARPEPPSPEAPAATPIEDTDRAVLRAYGYNDEQIADMPASQRRQEVQDAIESGVDPDEAVKADKAMSGLASMFGEGDKAAGTKEVPVKVETSQDVERAAAAAATEYSPEQGEANNRQLGHIKWNGLDGSVEVAAGGVRKGTNPKTNEPWETTHTAPYGYWKNTIGADGMHVDAYFGPEMDAGHPVYVLDENDPATGKFRQIKTFAGFPSAEAARQAYLGTSSKTPDMIGGITPIDAGEFPAWVKNRKNTTKPAAPKAVAKTAPTPKGTLSLLQFIASRGGMRIDPDLRSMGLPRNIVVPGMGHRSLLRSGGMSRDQVLEAAREAGYLPPAPSNRPDDIGVYRQLLDMLDEENRGRKSYPQGREPTGGRTEEAAAEQSEADRDKLMALFIEAGVDVDTVEPLDLVEAERIMRAEGVDAHEALQMAAMRATHEENMLSEAEFDNLYGEEWWDAVQTEPALQDGADAQAESVEDRRPRAEGRDDAQSGDVSGAREDRVEQGEKAAGIDDVEGATEAGQAAEAAKDREQVDGEEEFKTVDEFLDHVESEIAAGRYNADIAPTRDLKEFRAAAEARGWTYGPYGKGKALWSPDRKIAMFSDVSVEGNHVQVQWGTPFDGVTPPPVTEKTGAGEQTVLPGAEKIGQGEQAQREADKPLKPKKAQKPADEGLFGDERNQGDLLDEIKKKPAEEKGEAETSSGEIETVTQAEPEVDQKKAKLEDAGEKIGGARKDQWAGTLAAHDLDEMTGAERDKNVNKQNIWPRLDYAQLVEDGVEPMAAALIKRIYDRIPAKYGIPRYAGWSELTAQVKYIQAITAIRDVLKDVKTVDDLKKAPDRLEEELNDLDSEGGRGANIWRAAHPAKSRNSFRNPIALSYDDRAAAERMVKDGFPEIEPWKRVMFVREDSGYDYKTKTYGDTVFWVWRKSGGRIEGGPWKTLADAEAAAKKAHDETGGRDAGEGKEPKRPHLDDVDRAGPDYRKDRDVTGDDFITDFGFRGVEFGNWVASDERQKVVNLAYDALHDLARVLNLSPKALSLDGKLSIAFGARGRGGKAAAHYEPDRVVINMTKLVGAGSLAHEWAHAVDHYLGELATGKDYKQSVQSVSGWYEPRRYEGQIGTLTPRLSRTTNDLMNALLYQNETEEAKKVRVAEEMERLKRGLQSWVDHAERLKEKGRKGENITRSLNAAKRNIESWERHLAYKERQIEGRTVKIDTEYYKQAKKLSGKQAEKGYWARPTEMFARAFEAWVFDQVQGEGNTSQYLVQGVEGDRYGTDFKGNPYPAGAEREAINKAFDRWAKSLATGEGKHGAGTKLQGSTEPEPVEQTTHNVEVPEIAPEEKVDQLEAEMAAVEESTENANDRDLSEVFAQHLRDGKKFEGILAARKMAKEAGHDLDPKQIEEALELAVVKVARGIATQGSMRPDEVYSSLVNLYGLQPRLGTRTSTSMREQAFSTPVPLAYLASRLAGIGVQSRVYEPTAGNGALLLEATPSLTVANEINPARAENLENQGFAVQQKDASEAAVQAKHYDVVIANPPFGAVRQEDQSKVFDLTDIQKGYETKEIDHAIALRSLAGMRDKGRAVLIVGGLNKVADTREARSDGYNSKAKREFYKVLYDRYNVTDHFTVAGELYERQGAGWPVDVIVIEGRGKSQRSLPAVDVPRVYSTWDDLGGLLNGNLDGTGRIRGLSGTDALGDDAGGSGRGNVSGGEDVVGQRDSDGGNAAVEPSGVQPVAVSEQSERGAADSQEGAAGGQTELRKPGGNDPLDTAERSPSGLDFDEEFEAAFGAAREETFGAQEAPKSSEDTDFERGRANAAKDGPDGTRRRGGSQRERDGYDAAKRTSEVAKSAVSNAVESTDAAMSAIVQMFGGGKTINMGVPFTPENYAKAKPLLIKAAERFAAFKDDVTELVKRMVGELQRFYGLTLQGLDDLKPFLKQFIADVRAGAITLGGAVKKAAPVKQEKETAGQVAYAPESAVPGLGTLSPINMWSSIKASLKKLAERVGNIDEFVAKELGYKVENLRDYIAGEQVDALALAIDNIQRGKGFIIGDQTGIGKGRVNAAIIRWAIKNGHIPIFVTEKPNLYGDMYRDLQAVRIQDVIKGNDVNILMTNNSQTVPLDEDGEVVLKTGDKQHVKLMELAADGGIGDHDVVFTTYNQMQSQKGKETGQRNFLRAIAPKSILIFDESHNAGGQSQERKKKDAVEGRASLARSLIQQAKGVFYSSATYAKRPDVMDLYSKTDMVLAVEKVEDLAENIARGGVPMQQAVAAMLAEGGQYIRRERSFDGVTYDTPIVLVSREQYDSVARSLSSIQDFSAFIPDVVDRIRAILMAEGSAIGKDDALNIHSTNFTAIMHNIINQMLLSLKAKPAVDIAIEALKNNEKPVFTVSGTMEAFLDDYADAMGLKAEDVVDADFSDVLLKYLDRTRTITIKEAFEKKGKKRYLTDKELGPVALKAYRAAKELIGRLDLKDLPISPIDYIKSEIQKAGYSIGEITGRTLTIDYSTKKPTLSSRGSKEKSIAGRRKSIRDYNSGALDAMIINQAGATGLSLHASVDFKDQRRRSMIIVAPEGNIDTHMQMLGRIHRTGQVITPAYSQIIADVPAEKRPAAVLAKKMASLNANTTASRGGALTAKDVPDFINEYGDLVAISYLTDHPEINPRLAFPVDVRENGTYDPNDAMRKLTGRIPLLPLAQQEEVYAALEGEYNALIEQMKAAGENALEAQSFDLKARTLETTQVVLAKDGSNSPFAAPVNIERVSVARLGKPFKPAEVMNKVSAELGGGTIEGDLATLANMLDMLNDLYRQGWGHNASDKEAAERNAQVKEFEVYKRSLLDEVGDAAKAETQRANLDAGKDRWSMIHSVLTIGRRVTLKTASGNLTGIVLKVEQKGEPKNPLALSTWKATFAIADASRQITIPFSRLWEDGKASEDDALAIEVAPIAQWIETPKQTLERFEQMQSDAREERFIATGNILAAYDWLDRKGSIINYTAEDGTTRQGIITSRQFDLGKHAVMKGKPLRDPQEVKAWLDKNIGQTIWAKGNVIRIRRVPSRYGQISYSITAEKKKATGGKFYLDKGLTGITGDFYSSGGGMNADVGEASIIPAIERMQNLGAVFTVQGEPPKPTKAGDIQANIRQNAVQLRPEVKERKTDIAAMLQNIVRRVAGPQARVQFAEALPVDQPLAAWGEHRQGEEGVTAGGIFVPAENLIILALNDPKWSPTAQITTAFHEAFHSIENNLLTPQELSLMKAEDARLRQIVKQAFGFSDSEIASIAGYEIRAMAFEHYVDQRSRGLQATGMHVAIRRGFERLMQLFRQIRNALNGMGFQTSEDIFAAAMQGEIGQRGATQPRTLMDVMRDMEPEALNIRAPELAPERRGAAPEPERIADKLHARNLPKLASISQALGFGKFRPTEARTQVQDKFIRVKKLQQAQEKATGPVPERMDTYGAESLYYGRTGEQIERLDRQHIDPLIREIKNRGLTLEQVDDYLYARHAPARNERMRAINPNVENGSGMSDEEAAAILDAIPPDKLADYQAIERRVRAIIDQTNETRLRGGLISQETLDKWNAAYPDGTYIPMRGFNENAEEVEDDFLHVGSGFDVRGPESRRALGRDSRAAGPLAYVISQAQEAIVRAEKDRVGRTFLRYAQANPNPGLWTINTPPTKRVISPLTGMVVEVADPAWIHRPDVFAVKVGGKPHYIQFHGENGKDIARALKNIGTAQVHAVIRFFSALTRLFARMQTAWNTEFWFSNLPRDVGEALINLQAQDQKRFSRLFLKYLIPSIGGAFRGQMGKFEGRYSKAFEEFDKAGGRIRFFGIEDPDDIRSNVASKLRRLEGGAVNGIIGIGEKAVEGLEIAGGAIENATRLAAYMAAREVGLTQAQAAKLARELTVNFNRKGELGGAISALYAFANAGVQGIVRSSQALKHPRVRRMAYGLAAAGALLALYNIGMGGDDDDKIPLYEKIPPWDRDKNFIFMWPKGWGKKGQYSKIPIPFGFGYFHVIGARIASYLYGATTKEKALSAIFKSLVDAYDPIGRDENMVAQFAPTITRPGVHLYTNKNWTGRPINPENPYGRDHRPDSERHFDSASKFSIAAAKQMNSMSGGSPFKSGYIDVSPGTLDYMMNFLGGGVGRFVAGTVATPWKLYQGEEIKGEKTPIVRRFYGKVDTEAFNRNDYYEQRDAARDSPVSLARKAAKRNEPGAVEAVQELSKNATRADLGGEQLFDKYDRAISKWRTQERKVQSEMGITEETRRQKIEEIRAEINTLRNQARSQYKDMKENKEPAAPSSTGIRSVEPPAPPPPNPKRGPGIGVRPMSERLKEEQRGR